MPLRLFYFESDNAADAVQLATALVGRTIIETLPPPTATVELPAPSTEPAALPAPTKPRKSRHKTERRASAPIAVKRTRTPVPGGPRDKAEAILRKAGKPMRRAEVARKAGIPKGSATNAFRDPRFVVTPDGLLWLAEQDDPRDEADESDESDDDEDDDDEPSETKAFEDLPPPPIAASTKSHRADPPTVAELKQAIKLCGPMATNELVRYTGFSHAACHAALQSPEFERDTDGLYWLKNS